MQTLDFYISIREGLKPLTDSYEFIELDSGEGFEYRIKDNIFLIALQYKKYVIFYKKLADGTYISKIPAKLSFNPVLCDGDNYQNVDGEELIKKAQLYTNDWSI